MYAYVYVYIYIYIYTSNKQINNVTNKQGPPRDRPHWLRRAPQDGPHHHHHNNATKHNDDKHDTADNNAATTTTNNSSYNNNNYNNKNNDNNDSNDNTSKALIFRPAMILCGASAYPRVVDFRAAQVRAYTFLGL